MTEHNPLAQEMTAQLQLGMFGTVGKLARQLRAVDRIAPKLKAGGMVRPINIVMDRLRRVVGISAASRNIQAFSGLLYGVGALAHHMSAKGSDIANTGQQSRMDVGDMSLLEHERRIKWKTYRLVYELLEEVFTATDLPDLVLLDVPLVMGREVYANAMAHDETDELLEEEISELRDRLELFWNRHIDRCFPFDPGGPRIVTLRRGRFAHLLRLVHAKGAQISPDPISAEVTDLVQKEWPRLLSVGVDRLIKGILAPEHRSAAFDYAYETQDPRAFPKSLVSRGSMGFHYLTGLRAEPVQVEVIGAAAAWMEASGSEALDNLAADLMALTFFDHKQQSWPLPLWYARHGVEVVGKKGILEFYKREAMRTMKEEQVDQAWLAGWEE
jgi:hypothetical protein